MNKKIYIIAVVYCASITACDEFDPRKYHGGVMGNYLYQASKNILVVAQKAPEIANKSGVEFAQGALSQFPKEKQMEIGCNMLKGALLGMSSDELQQVSYDVVKGGIEGAGAAALGGATLAAKAAVTKAGATAASAKAATIAGATTVKVAAVVAAPYVAGVVVIGAVGYGGYKCIQHCEDYCAGFAPYERCLNTYATDPSCQMNDRGLPKRCESPERKMDQLGYFGYSARKPDLESEFKKTRAKLRAAVDKK